VTDTKHEYTTKQATHGDEIRYWYRCSKCRRSGPSFLTEEEARADGDDHVYRSERRMEAVVEFSALNESKLRRWAILNDAVIVTTYVTEEPEDELPVDEVLEQAREVVKPQPQLLNEPGGIFICTHPGCEAEEFFSQPMRDMLHLGADHKAPMVRKEEDDDGEA
jgi:hypothetical protein